MVHSTIFASALVLASATYEEFKAKYGKEYNGEEDEQHRAAYEDNMAYYAEINAQDLGFELGENQFADLTQEQYRVAAGLGYIPMDSAGAMPILDEIVYNGEDLASSVDWRERGAVTNVKDQGQCGSCWAFSTTGGIEGAWQIATGSLKHLSEQQLVDCSTKNAGCKGGNAAPAVHYLEGVNVANEHSYPYKGHGGYCKTSGYHTAIPRGGVSGYSRVGRSKNDMKSAVQRQPVSVGIEADQIAFQGYKMGVLSHGCGTDLDHAVLVVGYGTSKKGKNYWLVKNSWGTSWGKDGYIKISSDSNVCGVLNDAIIPRVSGSVAV